ncbi:MAG: aminopeptidase [Candidatus Aenigmarchaeota archaeon]|nr:aminopeptidase [Candidatus Aenigmarchaeota archaeon]
MNSLMKGARMAVKEYMNIKPKESVIIITDNKMPRELSDALFKAVKELGASCTLKLMEPLKRNGQEPPEEIAELMKKPDALFLLTYKSLSHTKARRDASKAGVRIASMPGVTEFSFTEGGLTANCRTVKELTEKMYEKVQNSKTVRITSENGTDFTAGVEGREWKKDDGIIHEKGKFGNLPAGEICVAPVEGTSSGVIIIDRMADYGNRVKYTVKDGFARKIEGSELLEKEVDRLGLKARNIAEIGIGTNPNAKIIGNVLEDEKVFGTIHVALGDNLSFAGNINVPLHVDGIILNPTLEVDGKILIKDGKWVFLEEDEPERENPDKARVEISEILNSQVDAPGKVESHSLFGYEPQETKKNPYEPYIVREPLESHYFDPWIGGWTRLNNRFVINPQLYGYWIKIVEIHEKIHNIYKTGDEAFVERVTWHYFRNGYLNLSSYS